MLPTASKSSTGRCHYSYPLYHVDNKLLSYQETVDNGLLEEEVYVPVKPEEYNFTEEEEAAALAKLNEEDMEDIDNIGVEQPEESSADDAGDDEDVFGSNDDENKEETKMDSTKASKKKKKGKKRTKEPASLPVSVLNSYGRQALGCSLGQKHMPKYLCRISNCKRIVVGRFLACAPNRQRRQARGEVQYGKKWGRRKIVIVKTDAL